MFNFYIRRPIYKQSVDKASYFWNIEEKSSKACLYDQRMIFDVSKSATNKFGFVGRIKLYFYDWPPRGWNKSCRLNLAGPHPGTSS